MIHLSTEEMSRQIAAKMADRYDVGEGAARSFLIGIPNSMLATVSGLWLSEKYRIALNVAETAIREERTVRKGAR